MRTDHVLLQYMSVALHTLAEWVRVFRWDHVHLTCQRDVKAHYSRPSRLYREREKMTSRCR